MLRFRKRLRWCAIGLAVLVCGASWFGARARAAGPAATATATATATANIESAQDPVKPQDPRVWAGVSASVERATTNAMFSVADAPRLMIGVALVNDGEAPFPFDYVKTHLIINGQSVEPFDANGPVWTEVRRGKPFGASTGMPARYFSKPGLYKI